MTTLDWAGFFSMRYAIWVDGIYAHDAELQFTPHSGGGGGTAQLCLAVTLKPIGARGSADGYFHLQSQQCADHMGEYQKPGPLKGGVMECRYTGTRGDKGFIRAGFWEVPPSDARLIYGEWRGTVFEHQPENKKYKLQMIAKAPKPRPRENYPWNL